MRCYFTHSGVMGWIPSLGKYMLFSTESDYIEYYHENG